MSETFTVEILFRTRGTAALVFRSGFRQSPSAMSGRGWRWAMGWPLSRAASSVPPVAVPQLPIGKVRLSFATPEGAEVAASRRTRGGTVGSSHPSGRRSTKNVSSRHKLFSSPWESQGNSSVSPS